MLRSLCKLTNTFKIKKYLWVQPLAKYCTVTKSNIENNVQFSKYEDKILKLVNTSTLKKLTQFTSASFAERLILIRSSDGLYKSLDDILLKNKTDVDSWNNFCTSLVNHYKKKNWKKLIKCDIDITAMPATILGIHVGYTAITWTLVDCNFNMIDWDSIIWRDNSKKYDIIDSVPRLVEQLPLPSAYVIEEIKLYSKSNCISNMMRHQIVISIASCIKIMIKQSTNNSNSSANILYLLKPSAVAYFFNLQMASEALAVDYVLKAILGDTKTDNELLQNIHIPHELKKKYMGKKANEREQMGWSVLTTLACLHIVRSFIS